METGLGRRVYRFGRGILPVCFLSKKDYDHVLIDGLWVVLGHYLTVLKWKPNFRPLQDKITSTPLWVSFPEIPIEFFQEKFFLSMGNLVGQAMKVNPTTLSTSSGKFSRVCMEIDFGKPLVPSISVLGHIQAVSMIRGFT